MDSINWSNYKEQDFLLFCNALLSFEIGKTFQGFSASGKDGGIDGLFEGSYDEFTGKFRFQYKFRSGVRSQAVSNLKSVVKKELSLINDENYFVLVTNIELLPQEKKELKDEFDSELQKLGKECSCWIWEGTKLFNLYLQFPLLELWLTDGFNSAQLREYPIVFSKYLTLEGFKPGTFHNMFIARSADILILESFLSDDRTIALVTGEAGIGKTRLVIEFFRSIIDERDDWSALVLQNRNIEFDKIRKALAGDRNYVILIDDAHTYSPEIIADIKRICDGASNKVKLILTARNLEAFKSLQLLKEYEKDEVLQVRLDNLSRPDTEELFRKYISGSNYENFITELVELSYGKPILVIAMLQAMYEGMPTSEIRKKGSLRGFVTGYFDSFYNELSTLTGWSKLQSKRILQHIVLIEPLNYSDSVIVKKIAEKHNVLGADLSVALKLLIDNGYVDGRWEQSVKPDYYSDIILSEIDQEHVVDFLAGFPEFFENMIINLSSVDEISGVETKALDKMLNSYVGYINGADTIELVHRVLNTVIKIAPYKPGVAIQAIQNYLNIVSIPEHVIYRELVEIGQFPNYSGDSGLAKVQELLVFLLHYSEHYDFVVRKALILYERTGETKISNIYAFSRRDVAEKFRFTAQQFIIQHFSKKIKKLSDKEAAFATSAFRQMLNLEFTFTGSSPSDRSTLIITTAYLPSTASVKKLRRSIIDLFIKMYDQSLAQVVTFEILKAILDVPRTILSTQRNEKPYVQNEEIETVFNFLEQKATLFELSERKEVQDKLHLYERWGIDTDLLPQIQKIQLRLHPKNLSEQISQLFTKAEIDILNPFDKDGQMSAKCDELIAMSSKEEMAVGLASALEGEAYPPHFFSPFLNRMIDSHPEYAKEFYLHITQNSPKLFDLYGATLLGGAYFTFKDEDFYWAQVKALQLRDTEAADNVLLTVYGRRVPGMTTIHEADTEVIIKIFNKKRTANNFSLASGLQSLIVAEHPEAMRICREFLSFAGQREAGMFFIWLSDNSKAEEAFLTDLVLNHTQRFSLSYELERSLNRALKFSGSDIVFEYLKSRFDLQMMVLKTQNKLSGYEYVPPGDYSHLFDDCLPDLKQEMFYKAVLWYLELDGPTERYFGKDLLEYLQPGKSLNAELIKWYSFKVEEIGNDLKLIARLMETWSIFHIKDESLVDLVTETFTIAHEYSDTQEESYKLVRQEGYLAITTLGVKSGAVGQPFKVDLDVQALLKNKITTMPDYLPATLFLRDVLKAVEAEINQSFDRDNFIW
ncbi:ATP-binding protein [Chitinophaga sp. RAB17]|uniref:ATP-binding protein n=1 Tax=Chitinophaga sp. RAB17 TaxID=3233049 RepID=UPI003F91D1A6